MSDAIQSLERRLRERQIVVTGGARTEILAAVASELDTRQQFEGTRLSIWAFATAVAATALICLNVAQITASVTKFMPDSPGGSVTAYQGTVATQPIDQIDPQLQLSAFNRAAVNLPSMPSLPPSAREVDFDLEGTVQ